METFSPGHCFETDIEAAFSYKFDRFRITRWLNSIENLDDFIFDDEYDVKYFLTEKEHEKWLEEIRDENDS